MNSSYQQSSAADLPEPARRYRRTVTVCAASVMLVVASLGTAAHGQADIPSAGFVNGTANATAIVSRVAPGVGALELGMANGVAVSEVITNLAQAQAETLDLGLVGTSITAEQCDGSAGVPPEDLPQPTRTDNRKGDASVSRDETRTQGSPFGAGRMEVSATTQPLARAIATTAGTAIGPVVTIGNGRAEALTQVIPGKAREAVATVSADVDIAGVVKLRNMKWEALHRTGADAAIGGTFDVGSGTAVGAPLPVDSLGPLQSAINTALAATGITVELPRVEHLTTPVDLVRVTPMRIVLKDSPAGATVLGPPLALTRAQREQLFNEITAAFCRAASVLLIGDIATSVVSGTGFLAVEIGGADATTAEVAFENPFGNDSGLPPTGDVPPVASGVISGSPGLPGTPGSNVDGGDGGGIAAQPTGSNGPLEKLCESIHPFHWPSCSNGAAVPLGLLGLMVTGGVAALDWRHQRSRRNRRDVVAVA